MQDMDKGKIDVAVNEILSYAASANNSIVQMQQAGDTVDQIDFMLPSDTDFNTDPTIHKLFHPNGGGLNYKRLPKISEASDGVGLDPGYYVGRFSTFEWTPTSTQDVVFTAYEISEDICAALNLKVTGSATIPAISGDTADNFFVDDDLHSGSNADFMVANCAACEEKSALCVSYTSGTTKYAFYSLLEAE